MSTQEHKQKIWNFIQDIKVGMLVTEDDADLRARPMHIVQKEYNGTMWFFTKRSAEKVTESLGSRKVCLTFSDPSDDVYISLTGTAKLSQDAVLIDKFWSPFAAAWFDGGKDDPDVALLEIKIHQGEHWNADDSKVVQLYEIAKANLTDQKPDLGENEKFG